VLVQGLEQRWDLPADGGTSTVIGRVDYDPIDAAPRWQPWPKLEDGRTRDELLADSAH
jgi:hypothetical protein